MKAIKLFAAVALVTLSAAISSPVSAQENGNKDENGKVVRGPYLTNNGPIAILMAEMPSMMAIIVGA